MSIASLIDCQNKMNGDVTPTVALSTASLFSCAMSLQGRALSVLPKNFLVYICMPPQQRCPVPSCASPAPLQTGLNGHLGWLPTSEAQYSVSIAITNSQCDDIWHLRQDVSSHPVLSPPPIDRFEWTFGLVSCI